MGCRFWLPCGRRVLACEGQIAQKGKLCGKALKNLAVEPTGIREHGAAHLDDNHTGLGENAGTLLLPAFCPLSFRPSACGLRAQPCFRIRALTALPAHMRSVPCYSLV